MVEMAGVFGVAAVEMWKWPRVWGRFGGFDGTYRADGSYRIRSIGLYVSWWSFRYADTGPGAERREREFHTEAPVFAGSSGPVLIPGANCQQLLCPPFGLVVRSAG